MQALTRDELVDRVENIMYEDAGCNCAETYCMGHRETAEKIVDLVRAST